MAAIQRSWFPRKWQGAPATIADRRPDLALLVPLAILTIACLAPSSLAVNDITYTARSLDTPPGLTSQANGLNNRGEVAGVVALGAHMAAVLWRDGQAVHLGTLGGTFSSAAGVNDAGDVVGAFTTAAGRLHAFLWQRGAMIDLDSRDTEASGAQAINVERQAV